MVQTNQDKISNQSLENEAKAFDQQIKERLAHGFVPDLRRLQKVEWLYNNVWRDPELIKIHWLPRLKHIVAQAQQAGPNILEVGCGPGLLSLELARHGRHVTGVDLSAECIKAARQCQSENSHTENFGSLEYICGDVMALELLPELWQALKPTGKIIISEPVRHHFNHNSAQLAALLRLVLPTWKPLGEKLAGQWHDQRWEEELDRISEEYTRRGEHEQSPLDNSLDSQEGILQLFEKDFEIEKISYSDAFMDKLIGGLRGESKYELARFLSFLDGYLVRHKILPPTSLELTVTKK